MYIYYWNDHLDGVFRVHRGSLDVRNGYETSECRWIVPGTIDIND